MKTKKILSVILVALFIFSFTVTSSIADVGNFNNYDSGHSGSGGWDSDFGSDSGSGNNFFFFSSDDGDDSESDPFDFIIGIAVFALIIVVCIVFSKRKIKTGGTPMHSLVEPDNMSDAVEASIKEHDPGFTSEKLISYASEVFISLQEAWTKRDWHIVRVFESEALFNLHSKQLDEYIRNKQINIIERVCVDKAYIINHQDDGTLEKADIYMVALMNDYIIDEESKKIIKGNKDTRYTMRYRLEFIRSSGVKTAQSAQTTTNCPNCGAPTQITSAGECEYCHSVIVNGKFGWVLNKIEGIR